MKKIFKTIYPLILGLAAVFSSCSDETRFPEFQDGANMRLIIDPNKSFINFDDLSTASVEFVAHSINNNIDKVEIFATYFSQVNGKHEDSLVVLTITQSDFVNGKTPTQVITATQLANDFGLENGLDDFGGGDSFTFYNVVTLNDGSVYSIKNSANSIVNNPSSSFTASFVAFIGCPSDREGIEGVYNARIEATNTYGIPPVSTLDGVTITFKGPEPFRYEVSSHDANWWLEIATGTQAPPADFFDICGTIIMQPVGSFGYGGANDNGGGSYDPETGVIIINWRNDFNDINGFIVYTPAD